MNWRGDLSRSLHKAALYVWTVWYLKPLQIWSRLAIHIGRGRIDQRTVPRIAMVEGTWQAATPRRVSMTGPQEFCFLNEAGALPPEGGWEVVGRSKLWLYNLHYFDDLNAVRAGQRARWHRELIARWVEGNPVGYGTGWEPYPTSLRIVNWIKWNLAGNPLDASSQHSLAVQARRLARHLETHLLGNHLFANAKALVFAGCYFEGPEAEGWLSRGMGILEHEVSEQILGDGGHFERSTMYHSLVFEDLLDLLNIARANPTRFERWRSSVSLWPDVARRMGRWLSVMCHPDGEIAFFNDAAVGIAPQPHALQAYARRLGVVWDDADGNGYVWLDQSGYVRAQRGEAVLFVDVAPIGPDYLPGHAHADTLTFELSLRGQRVVVNSGTSRYDKGEQRERERGTAAHNTVEVEGQNSSEVWAGFRVARRARPFDVTVQADGDVATIVAAHDGYRRLRGRVIHRRTWVLRDGAIEVVDLLEGRVTEAVAWVHFHPAWRLDDGRIERTGQSGDVVLRWNAEGCEAGVVESTWHPEFGVSLRSSALALRFLEAKGRAGSCRFVLSWR